MSLVPPRRPSEQPPAVASSATAVVNAARRVSRMEDEHEQIENSPPSTIGQMMLQPFSKAVAYCMNLPIVTFYSYMWRTNRGLLYFSLFVNYAFPILLETLPWYFSRRVLASRLRDMKNVINHSLISSKPLEPNSLGLYVLLTLIYAAVHTLDQILKNRVVCWVEVSFSVMHLSDFSLCCWPREVATYSQALFSGIFLFK
jgi:hypothetical protein